MELHIEQMLYRDQRTIKVRYLFGDSCAQPYSSTRRNRPGNLGKLHQSGESQEMRSDSMTDDALSIERSRNGNSSLYFNRYCHNQYCSKFKRLPYQTETESCACDGVCRKTKFTDKPAIHKSCMTKSCNFLILSVCLLLLVFPSASAAPSTISSITTLRYYSEKMEETTQHTETVSSVPNSIRTQQQMNWSAVRQQVIYNQGLANKLSSAFMSEMKIDPDIFKKNMSLSYLPNNVPVRNSSDFNNLMQQGFSSVMKRLTEYMVVIIESLKCFEQQRSKYPHFKSWAKDSDLLINLSGYFDLLFGELHLESNHNEKILSELRYEMPDVRGMLTFQIPRDIMIIKSSLEVLQFVEEVCDYFDENSETSTTPQNY